MSGPELTEAENYKMWRSRFAGRVPFKMDDSVSQCAADRGLDFIFPVILSGNGFGPYYEDMQKNVFLDLIGSIGVHILGCAHPVFLKTAQESAKSGFVMQTHLFPGKEYAELVRGLSALAGKLLFLDCCWLAPSGSIALETGVKLALVPQPPAKQKILSFRKTYFADSGKTAAENLALLTFPTKGKAGQIGQCRRDIETLLPVLKSDFGAFVFEPFLGEGGFRSADIETMKYLLQMLRQNGVTIVTDETQTFLKGTSPFASSAMELAGLVDVAIVGKSLQGAAVLYRKNLAPSRGILRGTFAGSTAALSSGLALLEFLEANEFFGTGGRNAKTSQHFVGGLQAISSRLKNLKIFDIDSCGLMVAFSIEGETSSSTEDFLKILFKAGVLASLCGEDQSRIRFHLPAIIEPHEIELALAIIEESLKVHAEGI